MGQKMNPTPKKKQIANSTMEIISRGRPLKYVAYRHTLPAVRVLESQYRKIFKLAKKDKASMSETIRKIIDSVL